MIELKARLKNVSALDTNVFILVTEGGKHVGDLTLVDDHILDKIDNAMADYRKKTGNPAQGPTEAKTVSLPITLTIKVR